MLLSLQTGIITAVMPLAFRFFGHNHTATRIYRLQLDYRDQCYCSINGESACLQKKPGIAAMSAIPGHLATYNVLLGKPQKVT
jgi:hypothetical protein